MDRPSSKHQLVLQHDLKETQTANAELAEAFCRAPAREGLSIQNEKSTLSGSVCSTHVERPLVQ